MWQGFCERCAQWAPVVCAGVDLFKRCLFWLIVFENSGFVVSFADATLCGKLDERCAQWAPAVCAGVDLLSVVDFGRLCFALFLETPAL